MSLRKRTFGGVRWTTVSSLGRMALQLLQVAFLARSLTPRDFGLVAVVIAIIAVIQIFSDAGVSNAIIHFQDIRPSEMDGLFWLNVTVSGALAFILALLSGLLASWYGKPELRGLLLIAALTLFVGATGQQLRVVAQKRFQFATLAKVELGGAVVGAVVAIVMAVLGHGAASIVSGSFATAAATAGLAWWTLSDGWRPKFHMRWTELRRFIRYGAYMIGDNLANTLNSQIDVLLGARLLGPSAIGLYSVPKDLSLRLAGIVNPIVTEVSLPLMANAQGDRSALKRFYLQMMRMIASVTFPAYIGLALFAPEVVELLLGPAWLTAIPLLRILALWALVRSTGNPVGTLVRALGRPDLGFFWNVVLLMIIPPAVWVGSRTGVRGMAFAVTLLAVLLYLPNWYFLVRPLCGARLWEYTRQLAVPLGNAVLAGAVGFVAAAPFSGSVARLGVGGASGAIAYFGISWYSNRDWSLAMLELAGRKA